MQGRVLYNIASATDHYHMMYCAGDAGQFVYSVRTKRGLSYACARGHVRIVTFPVVCTVHAVRLAACVTISLN